MGGAGVPKSGMTLMELCRHSSNSLVLGGENRCFSFSINCIHKSPKRLQGPLGEDGHEGPSCAGKLVLKGHTSSHHHLALPRVDYTECTSSPLPTQKAQLRKKHEMSHRLLRNDPGDESKSSLEESVLEVVMDLGSEPQVWAPLRERQRNVVFGRTWY